MMNSLELHEWMKLPMLVHHYFEHQSENKNETIMDFISNHYYGNNHHDKHHDDLPFKSNNCSSFHSTIVFYNQIANIHLTPVIQLRLLNFNHYEASFIQSFTGKIWQPPKA